MSAVNASFNLSAHHPGDPRDAQVVRDIQRRGILDGGAEASVEGNARLTLADVDDEFPSTSVMGTFARATAQARHDDVLDIGAFGPSTAVALVGCVRGGRVMQVEALSACGDQLTQPPIVFHLTGIC